MGLVQLVWCQTQHAGPMDLALAARLGRVRIRADAGIKRTESQPFSPQIKLPLTDNAHRTGDMNFPLISAIVIVVGCRGGDGDDKYK